MLEQPVHGGTRLFALVVYHAIRDTGPTRARPPAVPARVPKTVFPAAFPRQRRTHRSLITVKTAGARVRDKTAKRAAGMRGGAHQIAVFIARLDLFKLNPKGTGPTASHNKRGIPWTGLARPKFLDGRATILAIFECRIHTKPLQLLS